MQRGQQQFGLKKDKGAGVFPLCVNLNWLKRCVIPGAFDAVFHSPRHCWNWNLLTKGGHRDVMQTGAFGGVTVQASRISSLPHLPK